MPRFMLCTLALFGITSTAGLCAEDELPSYTFIPIIDEQLVASGGTGINDVRQVMGHANFVDSPSYLFPMGMLWDPVGGVRPVPLSLPSWDAAINNSGQITAGTYNGGWWAPQAVIWEEAAGASFIGAFWPQDINDLGEVVGGNVQLSSQGIYWNATVGTMTIPGFRDGRAINNAGQIVGQSPELRAVLSEPDGSLIDLGVLPGDERSIAKDISDSGLIVGTSFAADGAETAFVYVGGVMTPLDEGSKFAESRALAINDSGLAVGIGYDADGNPTPFLWQEGKLIDLYDLADIPAGFTLTTAADINSHGDIVGTCLLYGASHGYVLLTDAPVPPPSPPVPKLSIYDVSIIEGNKGTRAMSFEVTLSPAAEKVVTVQYATADETATIAGKDYVRTSGTLTFNPGEISRTINVSVKGDRTLEPDETFRLVLAEPTGALLSRAEGTGTIVNDDAAKLRRR
jgi:probable HAF family extracellular repeat protein